MQRSSGASIRGRTSEKVAAAPNSENAAAIYDGDRPLQEGE